MNSQMGAQTLPRGASETRPMEQVDLRREFNEVGIGEVLDQLDRELIGLKPVKTRIREIASLLLIERIRKRMNLTSDVPTLHTCRSPEIRSPARPPWRYGSPAFCTNSASCAAGRWFR